MPDSGSQEWSNSIDDLEFYFGITPEVDREFGDAAYHLVRHVEDVERHLFDIMRGLLSDSLNDGKSYVSELDKLGRKTLRNNERLLGKLHEAAESMGYARSRLRNDEQRSQGRAPLPFRMPAVDAHLGISRFASPHSSKLAKDVMFGTPNPVSFNSLPCGQAHAPFPAPPAHRPPNGHPSDTATPAIAPPTTRKPCLYSPMPLSQAAAVDHKPEPKAMRLKNFDSSFSAEAQAPSSSENGAGQNTPVMNDDKTAYKLMSSLKHVGSDRESEESQSPPRYSSLASRASLLARRGSPTNTETLRDKSCAAHEARSAPEPTAMQKGARRIIEIFHDWKRRLPSRNRQAVLPGRESATSSSSEKVSSPPEPARTEVDSSAHASPSFGLTLDLGEIWIDMLGSQILPLQSREALDRFYASYDDGKLLTTDHLLPSPQMQYLIVRHAFEGLMHEIVHLSGSTSSLKKAHAVDQTKKTAEKPQRDAPRQSSLEEGSSSSNSGVLLPLHNDADDLPKLIMTPNSGEFANGNRPPLTQKQTQCSRSSSIDPATWMRRQGFRKLEPVDLTSSVDPTRCLKVQAITESVREMDQYITDAAFDLEGHVASMEKALVSDLCDDSESDEEEQAVSGEDDEGSDMAQWSDVTGDSLSRGTPDSGERSSSDQLNDWEFDYD